MPDAQIAPAEARALLQANGRTARLLAIGEAPEGALPPQAHFVPARALRSEGTRGVVEPGAFARLCACCGVGPGTRVLLAGARGRPHAALAFWTFAGYGHTCLSLVDGPAAGGSTTGDAANGKKASAGGRWTGKERQQEEGQSETPPVAAAPAFGRLRALRDAVRAHLKAGGAVLDVRTPAEFSGVLTAPPDAPQEGVLRGGHLPGALHVPWTQALRPDGRLRAAGELESVYEDRAGLAPSVPLVVYSRTAARACHTWFVLTQVLGFEAVRVYDGGWAEWGNLVGAPVARHA